MCYSFQTAARTAHARDSSFLKLKLAAGGSTGARPTAGGRRGVRKEATGGKSSRPPQEVTSVTSTTSTGPGTTTRPARPTGSHPTAAQCLYTTSGCLPSAHGMPSV